MSDDAPQTEPAGNRTRGERIPAVERASGLPWAEWVRLFESAGAKDLPHAEIARIARGAMPEGLSNPDWWAQAATIAFEQHAGLRVPGQSGDGTFRVGASRTVNLDRDAAVEAWVAQHGALAEHLGHTSGVPRASRTAQRTFHRFNLEGAGKVEIAASAKGDDRASVTVSHEQLPDGERIEEWRAYWKGLLQAL